MLLKIKIKKNYYYFQCWSFFCFFCLVLVGQAECWLQPTGADQRGYNPDYDVYPSIMMSIHLLDTGGPTLCKVCFSVPRSVKVLNAFLCQEFAFLGTMFINTDGTKLLLHRYQIDTGGLTTLRKVSFYLFMLSLLRVTKLQ